MGAIASISTRWLHSLSRVVCSIMAPRFAPGDTVQTRLGKGVVREIGNGDRLTVEVQGRVLVVTEREISALDRPRKRSRPPPALVPTSARIDSNRQAHTGAEVDLHGLTVQEALDRVQEALSQALLADLGELRVIHGRSGGRIRAALQHRLRDTPGVRSFRLDPRNHGVTIVKL